MPQTMEGGKHLRQTMILKHGSEKAWKEFMRGVASKGGSAKVKTKGWGSYSPSKFKRLFGAKNKVAAAYGRKGGAISKRGKAHAR